MLTYLFWNIQKKPLALRVARIVATYRVDVVVLAESATPAGHFTEALNSSSGLSVWNKVPSESARIQTYTRLGEGAIAEIFNGINDRLVLSVIYPDGTSPLTLAVVHLPSRVSWTMTEQAGFAQKVADAIREREDDREINHRRTIVLGDFNMDPFDEGMVSGYGMHALMTRELAHRRYGRTIQDDQYPTFYNPMW